MGVGDFTKAVLRTIFSFILIMVFSYPVFALSSEDILRAADQARGNLEGVAWTVTITSPKQKYPMTLAVKARGFDIATETLAPAIYKRNQLLMIKGNMWFYKPGLSKPVPVSKRQKLMGNAAYGDIAATNYAADYFPSLLSEEEILGQPCYRFELTAKNKNSTYDRIMYWVSKTQLVGVKAEYYTISGKKFKTAIMKYENRVTMENKVLPFISRIEIFDELLSNDVTILDLDKPALKALPDYLFDLNLMRK
jgi:outer membrane lipoprotein-sorting protein